jgi:hypothetical protein
MKSSIAGAFLHRFTSNLAHKIKIKHRILSIGHLSHYLYMKRSAERPAKDCLYPVGQTTLSQSPQLLNVEAKIDLIDLTQFKVRVPAKDAAMSQKLSGLIRLNESDQAE